MTKEDRLLKIEKHYKKIGLGDDSIRRISLVVAQELDRFKLFDGIFKDAEPRIAKELMEKHLKDRTSYWRMTKQKDMPIWQVTATPSKSLSRLPRNRKKKPASVSGVHTPQRKRKSSKRNVLAISKDTKGSVRTKKTA